MRHILVCLFFGLAAVGCVPLQFLDPMFQEEQTALVPSSPFHTSSSFVPPYTKVSYKPSKGAIALRVDSVGRQILEANPEIGLKPLFATAGTKTPEIFHQGPHLIHITEGLVNQCQSDVQLAALLSKELAEMVAEREALAHPKSRQSEERPPIDVPIGHAGMETRPDMTRQAELARFEKNRQKTQYRLPLPDPDKLARRYLKNAGFEEIALDAVQPLLENAEKNYILEKQFKKSSSGAIWTPGP